VGAPSKSTRKPLRALVVEDSADDAELLSWELRRGGFDVSLRRVQTATSMRQALADSAWDVVLSDYTMPEFSALGALAVLHESKLDLPFIIMSGTIDEETAVEALRAGAHDFVVKHRMARLVPAIERELREANERRERRLAQEARDQAHEEKLRAEAANEAKSRLFANVTHELRTPLNAILGFSELLEQGAAGALSAQQAEYVSNVLVSGRHLLQLINDVLDLSKMEAGRLDLARSATEFAPIAAQVRGLVQPLVEKKGLSLTMSVPKDLPLMFADPTRVRQILFNLLSNAIKFTSPGGSIRLDARAQADRVEFAVEDTGVGIAPQDVPRVFGEFEQFGSGEEGTGLGLSITKKLVELHGGAIAVNSHIGQGTTFTVTIPLGVSSPVFSTRPLARMSAAPESVPASSLILVVEDDPPSQRLFRAILESRGHSVLLAATVEGALETARKRPPRLIISDMGLPGGGGDRLLKEIRSEPRLAKLPVLATTASGMRGARERLLESGFDEFVSKPLDIPQFCATVDALLAGEPAV
jgi:signal transduction histidine kinase